MSELRFEWDPAKAASNLRKHGVSFEDAQGVFYDERACCSTTRTTRRWRSGSFCWA
jgi:hypothetical protein